MNAITYALEFFKYQTAEFYFMHAYQNELQDHDALVSRTVFDDILDGVRSQSQINLKSLLHTVEKMTPNPRFTYHTISAYNSLVEEVNYIVESKNIDLIVMGTKGKANVKNTDFGSQTFQVLNHVKCPVLAIPSNYTNPQPKHILLPSDYSMFYKPRELKLLCDLATPYHSVIDVLYVSKKSKLSTRQANIQAYLKNTISKTEVNFPLSPGIKIAETIQNYIKGHAIDLLVMVNTRHSFLENMLFPSTLDKVSFNLTIPLLAMQNTARPTPNH